jgi:hypothetical protein
MKVCGIEMGNVAVLVGVDDDALWPALKAAVGDGEIVAAPCGLDADEAAILSRMSPPTGVIGLRNLGDSLHPSKHAAMVASLRAAGVPFVATTHSADVVDQFTGDEVIALHESKAACLSEHPEWLKWSTLIRTGEFWATVGESWVAGVERASQ